MRKQGSCLEKEIMPGTMPGAHRRGRPRTAWMANISTWTGLSMEESVRMTEDRDERRKYVHGRDAESSFFVGLRLWLWLRILKTGLRLRPWARIQTSGDSNSDCAPFMEGWPLGQAELDLAEMICPPDGLWEYLCLSRLCEVEKKT